LVKLCSLTYSVV